MLFRVNTEYNLLLCLQQGVGRRSSEPIKTVEQNRLFSHGMQPIDSVPSQRCWRCIERVRI